MIVLFVVFLMLSPAALLVSCPTTAEPVTASSRPAGAGGPFRLQPVEDPVDRDARLLGEMGPVQPRDRQHRLIAAVGARADQPRTDDRRAVRVELL